MVSIRNTQRTVKINLKSLEQQAQKMLATLGYADFDLGIWITTNPTIRHYNKTYRNKDKPTDILSFPFHPTLKPGQKIKPKNPEDKNLGDLIISAQFVKKDAPIRWNRSFEEQLTVLLAHGIAHLLGYDHETDQEFAVMQKVEKKLIRLV
jgi:probable rRNA maturation factor